MFKKKYLFLIVISVVLTMSTFVYAEEFYGGYENEDEVLYWAETDLMPIRNDMALYMLFLQMPTEKANVVDKNKFKVSLNYDISNITVSCFTPITEEYNFQIDMEVHRLALAIRYGLMENLEMQCEIPYIDLSRGVLDGFIQNFEKNTGARTPRSRSRQGKYHFNYSVTNNRTDRLINETEPRSGLGDLTAALKYKIVDETKWIPRTSLKTAVKLPTGSEKDLLSNGEYDYGIGVLFDKAYKRVFFTMNFNVIWPNQPSVLSRLQVDPFVFFGFATQLHFNEKWSMVAQVDAATTPFATTQTNVTDNNFYDAVLGFTYIVNDKLKWNIAVVENLTASSSADFVVHTGITAEF